MTERLNGKLNGKPADKLTGRIEFIPSPLDRLDPVAHAVRWWTRQMTDMLEPPRGKTIALNELEDKRRLPSRTAIALSETDAFTAQLSLPKGPASAHASAIRLRLRDLCPAEPADLQIGATAIAQAADGSATYAVAMARRKRLDELELQARRKGAQAVRFYAEGSPEIELKSAKAERRQRRALLLDLGIVGAILIAAVAATAVWTSRIEGETQILSGQERILRRAAIASETARRDADLARDFIDRGVLDRRAGAVLETLAQLNAATPDGAWWTAVRWSPSEITIAAQAGDAAQAIEAISTNAKGWAVELNGAINAGTPQSFELRLSPRKASAQ